MTLWPKTNCTTAPSHAAADAAVAGIVVLISFIISAFLTVVLSGIAIFLEYKGMYNSKRAKIMRNLVNGYAEQAILKGIAIQAVTLAGFMDTMVPYHFFIVWLLCTISSATHSIALIALQSELKKDWVIRWIKQGVMLINLMFSWVMSVFLFLDTTKQISPTLPMACVMREYPAITPRSDSDVRGSQAGTILIVLGQAVIFIMSVLWLHSAKNRWAYHPLRALSYTFLLAVTIGGIIRILQLHQLTGIPTVPLADRKESALNFGGFIVLLLLVNPPLNALRQYRNMLDHDEEFQSNPFFHARLIGGNPVEEEKEEDKPGVVEKEVC